MPEALGAGSDRDVRDVDRLARAAASRRSAAALAAAFSFWTWMSSMTTGLIVACLAAGLAKPIEDRALVAFSVPTWGPTTDGAATTLPEPSAAFAGLANVATRPPEAATIAAPFTAG